MPVTILGRRHLVVIAVGYAAGLAAFPWLPGPYFESVPSLTIRAAIALLIPTAALVTCLAADIPSTRAHSGTADTASLQAVSLVVFCAALFMVALHGLVLVGLLAIPVSQFSPHRLVVVMTGFLLLGVGNVLPRIRPNVVIGIRTRRLLENRTAWACMHRVAGYCLVAIGVITVAAGLALSKSQIPSLVSPAVGVAVAVNIVAYRRCARG